MFFFLLQCILYAVKININNFKYQMYKFIEVFIYIKFTLYSKFPKFNMLKIDAFFLQWKVVNWTKAVSSFNDKKSYWIGIHVHYSLLLVYTFTLYVFTCTNLHVHFIILLHVFINYVSLLDICICIYVYIKMMLMITGSRTVEVWEGEARKSSTQI